MARDVKNVEVMVRDSRQVDHGNSSACIVLKYLEGKKRRILDWLSPVNPEDDYTAAWALHTEGTGDWIFEENKFKYWLATPGSFLWVHGQSELP